MNKRIFSEENIYMCVCVNYELEHYEIEYMNMQFMKLYEYVNI